MSGELRQAGRRLVALGVAGAIGVGVLQLWAVRETVEDDLTERSVEALADAGLTDLDVRFSGRDGVVSGSGVDDADSDRAVQLVGDLRGVRVVRGENSQVSAGGSDDPSASATSSAVSASASASTAASSTSRSTSATPTSDASSATATSAATSDPGTSAASTAPTTTGPTATATTTAPTTTAPTATPTATPPTSAPPPADTLPANLMEGLAPITFANAKWKVGPEHDPTLQALTERILSSDPNQKWLIRAHTDTVGPKPDNLWLSNMRAMEVCEELIQRGVPKERLSFQGVGELEPLVSPELTPADRAANRRVDVVRAP